MNQNCQKFMIKITRVIELIVAFFLIVAILTALFFIVKDAFQLISIGEFTLDKCMNKCLMIIIGVEFVKMLILHTPESVMEVLLFVVARYVVVSHTSSLDILFGILSIALIFGVQKYLFKKKKEE